MADAPARTLSVQQVDIDTSGAPLWLRMVAQNLLTRPEDQVELLRKHGLDARLIRLPGQDRRIVAIAQPTGDRLLVLDPERFDAADLGDVVLDIPIGALVAATAAGGAAVGGLATAIPGVGPFLGPALAGTGAMAGAAGANLEAERMRRRLARFLTGVGSEFSEDEARNAAVAGALYPVINKAVGLLGAASKGLFGAGARFIRSIPRKLIPGRPTAQAMRTIVKHGEEFIEGRAPSVEQVGDAVLGIYDRYVKGMPEFVQARGILASTPNPAGVPLAPFVEAIKAQMAQAQKGLVRTDAQRAVIDEGAKILNDFAGRVLPPPAAGRPALTFTQKVTALTGTNVPAEAAFDTKQALQDQAFALAQSDAPIAGAVQGLYRAAADAARELVEKHGIDPTAPGATEYVRLMRQGFRKLSAFDELTKNLIERPKRPGEVPRLRQAFPSQVGSVVEPGRTRIKEVIARFDKEFPEVTQDLGRPLSEVFEIAGAGRAFRGELAEAPLALTPTGAPVATAAAGSLASAAFGPGARPVGQFAGLLAVSPEQAIRMAQRTEPLFEAGEQVGRFLRRTGGAVSRAFPRPLKRGTTAAAGLAVAGEPGREERERQTATAERLLENRQIDSERSLLQQIALDVYRTAPPGTPETALIAETERRYQQALNRARTIAASP